MPRVLPFEQGLPELQQEYSAPGSGEDPALDKLIKTMAETAKAINEMRNSQMDTNTAAHGSGSFPLTMAHSQAGSKAGSAEAFDEQVLILKLAFLQVAFMQMGIDTEHGKDGANFRTIMQTLTPIFRPLIQAKVLDESIFYVHENAGEFAVKNDLMPYLVSERNPYLEAYLQEDAKASADNTDKKHAALSELLLECYKATAKCLHRGLDELVGLDLKELEKQRDEMFNGENEFDDQGSVDGEVYDDPKPRSGSEFDRAAVYEPEEMAEALDQFIQARKSLARQFPDIDQALAAKLQTAVHTKLSSGI